MEIVGGRKLDCDIPTFDQIKADEGKFKSSFASDVEIRSGFGVRALGCLNVQFMTKFTNLITFCAPPAHFTYFEKPRWDIEHISYDAKTQSKVNIGPKSCLH